MKKSRKVSWCVFVLFLGIQQAKGQAPLEGSNVPGGIAVIELPHKNFTRPVAKYLGSPVLVMQNNKQWYAIVGLGLRTRSGGHTVTYDSGKSGGKISLRFNVTQKKYPTQYINGVQKSKVNLSDKDYKRHLGEKKLIQKAKKSWQNIEIHQLSLMLPVESRISGLFGRRRVFNKQPRNPHSGLDLAAAEGTPVLSPADGKVVLTGDYFFLGKTIFIEHGQGLISLFGHLNKIHIKNGATVKQGDLIADVGATGRASGPHLHWGIYLNQVAVDPLLLIEKNIVNALISGKTVKPEIRSASEDSYLSPAKSNS